MAQSCRPVWSLKVRRSKAPFSSKLSGDQAEGVHKVIAFSSLPSSLRDPEHTELLVSPYSSPTAIAGI